MKTAAPDEPIGSDADQDAPSPAERRKQRVRETIIEAAEEVFSAEGEDGLSMRRIAERIDYSPAAIYKYFKSKDELVDAIRELFFERLLVRIRETISGREFDSRLFRECMRLYIETGVEEANHYRLAFVACAATEAPEEGSTQFEAASYLESLIASGVRAGVFRELDPKLASKSVWAALHGLTTLMVEFDEFPRGMKGSEHVSRADVLDFHVELIFRGLAAEGAS